MDKTVTYLNLLKDSLQKKKRILISLNELTGEQTVLFEKKEKFSERYDSIIDEKQVLIDELNQLDDGFESSYNQIASVIKANKHLYEEQIKELQMLVSEVTDLGVKLKTQEMINKDRFDAFLKSQRMEIRQTRESERTATRYYQNMGNHHQSGQTYFLDKKN